MRMVVSFSAEQKAWLEEQAKTHKKTMAKLIREAVESYRRSLSPQTSELEQLLKKTSGTWTKGDGLAFQRRLRSDWNRR